MRARQTRTAAGAMAVLLCSAIGAAQADLPADLSAMVETEREFARTALVKGVRDAFLDFFSDDAIAFAPDPISAKERLRSRPAQPPSVQELKWEPRTGDVASSGDVGWLTGPAIFLNRAAARPAPQHSNYLSIWRKQPDGLWRVFIDLGIQVPEPVAYQPGFTRFPFANRYRGPEGRTAAAGALLAADRELNEDVSMSGSARAYTTRLTGTSRLNRNGSVPVVGREAIADWLAQNTPAFTARSTASDASTAGDLGYTYGTYEVRGEKAETGAYLRIWTREEGGRWWVVVDSTQKR